MVNLVEHVYTSTTRRLVPFVILLRPSSNWAKV